MQKKGGNERLFILNKNVSNFRIIKTIPNKFFKERKTYLKN